MSRWAKRIGAAALVLSVAACTRPAPPVIVRPPPVVVAPPAPRMMPVPPNSSAPTLNIPATDLAGRRLTPNLDLSPEQALWQLRIALNVAALNCRGPDEAVLVANYSRFLASNRAVISSAERWVIADQGRRNLSNGIAARDILSTRLYNYFAQPPVVAQFCRVATDITALAALEPAATIQAFSTLKLPEVDRPFVEFYAAYDRYRTDLAQWQAEHPQPMPTPATAPAMPPLR